MTRGVRYFVLDTDSKQITSVIGLLRQHRALCLPKVCSFLNSYLNAEYRLLALFYDGDSHRPICLSFRTTQDATKCSLTSTNPDSTRTDLSNCRAVVRACIA